MVLEAAVNGACDTVVTHNARAFAEQEGVSVNQLIATALAEKLATLGAEAYLAKRAARGTRSRFDAALAQVPDVEAAAGDQLPAALALG